MNNVENLGNDLARCLRWGGGYEGESIPKLLEKLARSDSVMMDRWNITIEASPKIDRDENIPIPSHKVLKVGELSTAKLIWGSISRILMHHRYGLTYLYTLVPSLLFFGRLSR